MTTTDRITTAIAAIRSALAGYVFRVRSEAELQDAVCKVLGDLGHGTFRREAVVDGGRCDIIFRIHHVTVVIELKFKASAASVERQAQRYALMPDVDAVLVVTTSRRLAVELEMLAPVSIEDAVKGARPQSRADLEAALAESLSSFVGRPLTEDRKIKVQRELDAWLKSVCDEPQRVLRRFDFVIGNDGVITVRDNHPPPQQTLGGKPFHVIALRTS